MRTWRQYAYWQRVKREKLRRELARVRAERGQLENRLSKHSDGWAYASKMDAEREEANGRLENLVRNVQGLVRDDFLEGDSEAEDGGDWILSVVRHCRAELAEALDFLRLEWYDVREEEFVGRVYVYDAGKVADFLARHQTAGGDTA